MHENEQPDEAVRTMELELTLHALLAQSVARRSRTPDRGEAALRAERDQRLWPLELTPEQTTLVQSRLDDLARDVSLDVLDLLTLAVAHVLPAEPPSAPDVWAMTALRLERLRGVLDVLEAQLARQAGAAETQEARLSGDEIRARLTCPAKPSVT
ncbi:hypothetical protein [Deinococcus pimensis]|uniref:hypothetical protein n=1 Tax=Deinococcus pimensis TaxID=309888 RepID=UPI0004AD5E9F|nr:hypothetical protein [Deinococcus pimensis]